MRLLKKILSFGATIEEMTHLWKIYCRSIVEQSAVVWSSSLTKENIADIERTQKSFAKLVLKEKYRSYPEALLLLNLESLEDRRSELSLQFAKKCLLNEKFSNLFPENENHGPETRNQEKYKVRFSHTERTKMSSIIQMQHLLNADHRNRTQT